MTEFHGFYTVFYILTAILSICIDGYAVTERDENYERELGLIVVGREQRAFVFVR